MRNAFQPPADRKVFTLPLEIRPEHIDDNGHVNNVVYVGWLQDVGTAHWNSLFPADERARWSWVALRHEIDYRRPLMPGDAARAVTWVGEPKGPRFDRFVLIEGPNGIAAQGRTEWCLVDARTMRPVRIPDVMLEPFAQAAE
ncbi:thioesterase family protein [Caulobacter sp. 17J80-11]|uniref:acyl-CoA thioesterase n=1 Tax=Caulobacter sp. 17J80-11 TaxID=2763502 RepID=UPI00165386AC|nr:acyl-CoA thioesterase [Caulobacter sp. 17J80-11]